jgi:hypothetical protein
MLLPALPILLASRRRNLLDWLLASWWVWQMLLWAMATHLFARFGVTTVIPIIALVGRSCTAFEWRGWPRMMLATSAVAAVLSVACSTRFAIRQFAADQWQWFGRTTARASLDSINLFTPPDARVLSVGNAATFYTTRPVQYAAALGPDPFAEQAEGNDAAAVIDWLREQGITHIVVNWKEIRRLSNTYGYHSAIDDGLFARLRSAGLVAYYPNAGSPQPPEFIQVFRVPTE